MSNPTVITKKGKASLRLMGSSGIAIRSDRGNDRTNAKTEEMRIVAARGTKGQHSKKPK